MRTQSPDTRPEVERVQIELLRKAGPARRLELGLSFSQDTSQLTRAGIKRAYPYASKEEISLIFIEVTYGKDLANRVRAYLAAKSLA
jgi:hypothetical protein